MSDPFLEAIDKEGLFDAVLHSQRWQHLLDTLPTMTRRYTISYDGTESFFWTPQIPGNVLTRFFVLLAARKLPGKEGTILNVQLVPMPAPFDKDARVKELIVTADAGVPALAFDEEGNLITKVTDKGLFGHVPTSDNWRDCETDAPPLNVHVLVQTAGGGIVIAAFAGGTGWYARDLSNEAASKPVLWQPLPTPRTL